MIAADSEKNKSMDIWIVYAIICRSIYRSEFPVCIRIAKDFNMRMFFILIIFVYLSSLPVAHLSDAPRRRLVVTGSSARIHDETTENSA